MGAPTASIASGTPAPDPIRQAGLRSCAGVYDQLHTWAALCGDRGGGELRSPPFEPAPLRRARPASGGPLNRPPRCGANRRNGSSCRAACRSRIRTRCSRRLRPGLSLRCPHAAGARAQEDMAARRQEPGRVGRGGAHLRKPVAAPAPKKPSNFHRKLIYPPSGLW